MNCVINSYERIHGKGILYCGLAELEDNKVYYKILEEAFNSFLVKIYLMVIDALTKEEIEDEELKEILALFDFKGYKCSYSRITHLFNPIFSNQEFFWLFYNAALYKDYDELFEKLESLLGDDQFYLLDRLLNEYYEEKNNRILQYFQGLKLKRNLNLNIKL